MGKIIFAFILLLPLKLQAQVLNPLNSGLQEAGQGTGLLTNLTLSGWISVIIRAVLSLLGIIFTVLIILGGFRWMTSGGSAEKVKSAKSLIGNAVIGLTIVLISYAVAYFVFEVLMGATGQGEGAEVTP